MRTPSGLATSPPPAMPPVARTTPFVRRTRSRAAVGMTTAVTRRLRAVDPEHPLPDRDPATAAPKRRPERVVEPHARHARRDERHLERDERQEPARVIENARMVGVAEDRR